MNGVRISILAFKYQLNPHVFLNALNSVSALVQKGDRDAAMGMLARIGDFLRLSLADPEETHHTLVEELDALRVYLDIERIRFGDRLKTDFQIEEEAKTATLPSFLLQPIFENAIKHAVGKSLEPTSVSLRAEIKGRDLCLTIRDSGPGVSSDDPQSEERQGIGLFNVRERLTSAYGQAFQLTLENVKPSGLEVSIQLPARQTALRIDA